MRLFQNQDLNEVLGKNLIKNQELLQEPHQKSGTSLRTSSNIKIKKRRDLIENLNENLNEVLPEILIRDEVLDEVLDSQ